MEKSRNRGIHNLRWAVLAVALLFGGSIKAQNFGINFGYASENFPTITNPFFESTTSQGDLTGFFGGVNYNLKLSECWGISVGVQGRFYTREFETVMLFVPSHVKEKQVIVDVPVLLNFAVPFNDESKLTLFAGGLASYTVVGSTTVSNNLSTNDIILQWNDKKNGYKPFNPQATAGIALTIKYFRIFGGYSLGILDIDLDEQSKTTTSNIYMGLSVVL